jgi:hypothetical protein
MIVLFFSFLFDACSDSENGDLCQNVTCSGHGSCQVVNNQAECDCDPGYHAQDLECIEDEVDPCENVTCSGHGSCQVVNNQAECDCDPGYHAQDLECIEDEIETCGNGVTEGNEVCDGPVTCETLGLGFSEGIASCIDCQYLDTTECCSTTPGTQLWCFTPHSSATFSPLVATDGTIYIVTYFGDLVAVAPNGIEKWRFDVDTNGHIWSQPVLAGDGSISFSVRQSSSAGNMVYNINSDGTLRWMFDVSAQGGFSNTVVDEDGTVYFCPRSYEEPYLELYAVDVNGNTKWQVPVELDLCQWLAIDATPTIYAASGNKVSAINSNGAETWQATIPDTEYVALGETEFMIDESEGSVVFGGPVYLYKVYPDGSYWHFPDVPINQAPPQLWMLLGLANDGSIYAVSDADGMVYALDNDGAFKWNAPPPESENWTVITGGTVAADGNIYMGSYTELSGKGSLFALSPAGEIVWSLGSGDVGHAPALGANYILYYVSLEGDLCAVATKDTICN